MLLSRTRARQRKWWVLRPCTFKQQALVLVVPSGSALALYVGCSGIVQRARGIATLREKCVCQTRFLPCASGIAGPAFGNPKALRPWPIDTGVQIMQMLGQVLTARGNPTLGFGRRMRPSISASVTLRKAGRSVRTPQRRAFFGKTAKPLAQAWGLLACTTSVSPASTRQMR